MNTESDDRLDARLRAAFAPPPATAFAAQARAVTAPHHGVRKWPWLLAAAALVVTLVLAIGRPARGPEGHDAHELGAMWAAAYADAKENGFSGGSCCTPGLDFGKACEEKFAVKLSLGDGAPVQLVGCYCGLPTGGCLAVLVRTNGDPVCVYVVPRGQDPKARLPQGSTLHLARREIGALVLYALSESPAAETLAGFVGPVD
ncbi:MAG TPA: hypothetical protein VF384_14845 [Planctomycetota bacterium]